VTLGITALTVWIAPPYRAVDTLQPFLRHDPHQRGFSPRIADTHYVPQWLSWHEHDLWPIS
jgi:hypothetical protein